MSNRVGQTSTRCHSLPPLHSVHQYLFIRCMVKLKSPFVSVQRLSCVVYIYFSIMSQYTVMTSERGEPLRVFEGYKFRFHKRLRNGIQRWTCSRTSCKSYVKFGVDGTIVEDHTDCHNHPCNSESDLRRQRLSSSLKRRATASLCDKPSKIIRESLMSEPGDITLNDIQRIRRNIYTARSQVRPPLPRTLNDLHTVLEEYTRLTTSKGERFLLVNDSQRNIIIFTTKSNLEFLSTCSCVYVDGTFKSVPSLFLQLFTIHGFRFNNYIPLVFTLLPNKTTDSYEAVLRHVLAEIVDLGRTYEPEQVYADYEGAIHAAVRRVWPNALIHGCRFHLGQSWWRRIQQAKLSEHYKDRESEVGSFLKLFFGLSCLHPDDVFDCFTDDIMPIQPDNPDVRNFTDYVFDNYIAPDSPFPPHTWAEYSSSLSRTTNSCESFHAHFNASFYSSHPHIFLLTDTLLQVQCEVYAKILDVHRQKKTRSCGEERD